jgi:hypothetical protein
MEFLSTTEVRARAREVKEALARILATRAVVGHRGAAQWRFLQACTAKALGESVQGFDGIEPTKAAQWKFQVQEKLRRYYERHAGEPGLWLVPVHESRLGQYRLPSPDAYPRLSGYCLLVRDPARDATLGPETEGPTPYLERVVVETAEAEFRAYAALPRLDTALLSRWLWTDGPAFREILDRLRKRRRTAWVITNAYNPSHHRTTSLKVLRVRDTRAVVNATEIWHLRWWNTFTSEYIYSFQETLRHSYVIEKREHIWRVHRRLRRPPREMGRTPATPDSKDDLEGRPRDVS